MYLGLPRWVSVKKPIALQRTQGQSLGQENPLEEEMATHSSILAWRIPWTEELLRLQSKRTEQLTLLFVLNFLIYLFNPNFSFLPWGKKESVSSVAQLCLFATSWTGAHQASLSITNSCSLLKLMSIESVMSSQQSHPLSSPSPPAFNLSQLQGLFQ